MKYPIKNEYVKRFESSKSLKIYLELPSKMMIIFKRMKNKNLPITEQEKIEYLLGCMPKDFKLIFISGKNRYCLKSLRRHKKSIQIII